MLSLLVEWVQALHQKLRLPKGNKKVILLNDNEESRCFSKLYRHKTSMLLIVLVKQLKLKLFSNIMLNNNSRRLHQIYTYNGLEPTSKSSSFIFIVTH